MEFLAHLLNEDERARDTTPSTPAIHSTNNSQTDASNTNSGASVADLNPLVFRPIWFAPFQVLSGFFRFPANTHGVTDDELQTGNDGDEQSILNTDDISNPAVRRETDLILTPNSNSSSPDRFITPPPPCSNHRLLSALDLSSLSRSGMRGRMLPERISQPDLRSVRSAPTSPCISPKLSFLPGDYDEDNQVIGFSSCLPLSEDAIGPRCPGALHIDSFVPAALPIHDHLDDQDPDENDEINRILDSMTRRELEDILDFSSDDSLSTVGNDPDFEAGLTSVSPFPVDGRAPMLGDSDEEPMPLRMPSNPHGLDELLLLDLEESRRRCVRQVQADLRAAMRMSVFPWVVDEREEGDDEL